MVKLFKLKLDFEVDKEVYFIIKVMFVIVSIE